MPIKIVTNPPTELEAKNNLEIVKQEEVRDYSKGKSLEDLSSSVVSTVLNSDEFKKLLSEAVNRCCTMSASMLDIHVRESHSKKWWQFWR